MGQRETEPRLKALWDKGIKVYSFSKLESINQCLYGAYQSYCLHKRGLNSCYGIAGGATHDCLEMITKGEATEADLLPTIQDTLVELETLGLDFPKGKDGSDSIKEGWIADMEHFCKTYKAPKGKFQTERFFLYKTDQDVWIQGYQDLIKELKDSSVDIYDYKTSTLFKGDDIKTHGRQLVIYALGLEYEGIKVRKVAWIFLKYAEVRFSGKKTIKSKNESELSKVIERKNIVKDLSKYIVDKLEKLGKDDVEIELIMNKALENNEIPEEVEDQFKMIPYVMYYDLTPEVRQECIDYINNTVKMWEGLSKNEKDYPPRKFTKVQKNGKEVQDIFFCSMLCNFRNECKYLKEFRDTWQDNKDDDLDDIFG